MKSFTAIYNTESIKGVQYSFEAVDFEAAKEFTKFKFTKTVKNLVILETPDLFKENSLIDLFNEVKEQSMLNTDGGSDLEIELYGKAYTLGFHSSWGGMVALKLGSEKIGTFKKFQYDVNRGKDSIYHLVN